MIRKLTLAATLAATAVALLAAMAPAANADYQEFYVTNSDDELCGDLFWETCVDTGYEGELDITDWTGNNTVASCDVSFDLNIAGFGQFRLDPIAFSNCWTSLPYMPDAEQCPYYDIPPEDYYGQISWPEGAPESEIEIEAVICYRIFQNHYLNRVLLHPSVGQNGLRTWTQVGLAESTGIAKIKNAVIEDTVPADNIKLVPGTPPE